MPNIWGIVRLNPKLTPEANNIKLFGPGVTEVTKAKMKSAMKVENGNGLTLKWF